MIDSAYHRLLATCQTRAHLRDWITWLLKQARERSEDLRAQSVSFVPGDSGYHVSVTRSAGDVTKDLYDAIAEAAIRIQAAEGISEDPPLGEHDPTQGVLKIQVWCNKKPTVNGSQEALAKPHLPQVGRPPLETNEPEWMNTTPLADLDDELPLSITTLANLGGVPHEALRKRLERERENNHNCFVETEGSRSQKESKYLYKVKYARPIIAELKKAQVTSDETSDERPTKKNLP